MPRYDQDARPVPIAQWCGPPTRFAFPRASDVTRSLTLTLAAAVWFSTMPVLSQDVPAASDPVPEVVAGITARELGAHMRFLASDLMRGRDTGSNEIRLAAEYLATRLEAAGAEPAGDGTTYFQSYPLAVVTPDVEHTQLELVRDRAGSHQVIPCALGIDVFPAPGHLNANKIEASVVFAGHGRVDEEKGIDDYHGLDVKGRIVLVLPDGPSDDENETRPRPLRMSDLDQARERANERGAIALLVIQPPGLKARLPMNHPEALMRPIERPRMFLADEPAEMPMMVLSDALSARLAEELDIDVESPEPRRIDDLSACLEIAARRELVEDRNVIGLFPGSDPRKAKEVVIFSAHYDHVGVDDDGQIYNGSDDNASGTSALLEIAEAIGDGPKPARGVAILWVSGEEKGLLGSKWFTDHISLPDDYRIVADINLDMVSRNEARTVGITPSPEHPKHTTLVSDAVAAAKAEGLAVEFNVDHYHRYTDSYNFAKGHPGDLLLLGGP